MKQRILFIMCCSVGFLFSACGPATVSPPVPVLLTESNPASPISATQTAPAITATQTPAPSATFTPPPPSETPISIPTDTATASPVPTYAILRGVVIPEKVSCRYGPGAMYLYLYGMVKGATQDVIGRTDTGKWVLTKSRGDNKSCWVKTEFIDLNGDVMSLEMVYPDKFKIIQSNQVYRKPWDVVAIRSGDQVTITWKSDPMKAGDEESATSVLYVVETWVCQGGQLIFTPIGAYTAQVTVKDEPGCAESSHGRVYFSEKHGYTGPTEIVWPAYR